MAEGGERYWNRHARRYDGSMRFLGRPIPRMLELVADAVRGRKAVLEVAAGTGLVTAAIARVAGHVTATDYAPAMLDQLRARLEAEGLTNVATSVADLHAAAAGGARYDAVVAANVLHLVPDLAGALAALVAAVRPGGAVVVPTFCHAETLGARVLSRLLSVTGFPAARRLTMASLRAACEAAGLQIDQAELIAGPIPIGFVSCVAPGVGSP